jgi:hypothetical protein
MRGDPFILRINNAREELSFCTGLIKKKSFRYFLTFLSNNRFSSKTQEKYQVIFFEEQNQSISYPGLQLESLAYIVPRSVAAISSRSRSRSRSNFMIENS